MLTFSLACYHCYKFVDEGNYYCHNVKTIHQGCFSFILTIIFDVLIKLWSYKTNPIWKLIIFFIIYLFSFNAYVIIVHCYLAVYACVNGKMAH